MRLTKKQLLYLMLAVYLALAVTGSITFSITEAVRFAEPAGDLRGSIRLISSMEYTVDWLSDSAAAIGRANRYPSASLRNGALRVFIFAATGIAVEYFAVLLFWAVKKYHVLRIKNTILLKRRI